MHLHEIMRLLLISRTFVICPLLLLVISLPSIENVPVPSLEDPTYENLALGPSDEDAVKISSASSKLIKLGNTDVHSALKSSLAVESHFSSSDSPNVQNENSLTQKETTPPSSVSGKLTNGQQNGSSSTSKESALKDSSGLLNSVDSSNTQSAVHPTVTSLNASALISNNKNSLGQHDIDPNSQSLPMSPSTAKSQSIHQLNVTSVSPIKSAALKVDQRGSPNKSTQGLLNPSTTTSPAAAVSLDSHASNTNSLAQQEASSNAQPFSSTNSAPNSNASSSTSKSTTDKNKNSPSSPLVNSAQEQEQQASPQSSSTPKSPPKSAVPNPGQSLGGNDGDIQKENGGEVDDDGSNEVPISGGERPENDGVEDMDETLKGPSTKGEVAADGEEIISKPEQKPIPTKEQTPSGFSPDSFKEPLRDSFSGEVSHRTDYNPEDENVGVFSYFLTFVVICGVGFFMLHHRKRIIAMLLEGRRPRGGRSRRSSSSSSGSYRKLENNFD